MKLYPMYKKMIKAVFLTVVLAWVAVGCISSSANSSTGFGSASSRKTASSAYRYVGYSPDVGDDIAKGRTEGAASPAIAGLDNAIKYDDDAGLRRMRSGDPVQILVRGIPQPDEIQDVIDMDGNLNIAYVGTVFVKGLTTTQAETMLEKAYIDAGIYLAPAVTVIAQREVLSDEFYIRGEVRGPGKYPLTEGMTLVQCITSAGGLTKFASSSAKVRRDGKVKKYSLKSIWKGKKEDPVIKRQDVITIPARII